MTQMPPNKWCIMIILSASMGILLAVKLGFLAYIGLPSQR